MLFAPFDGAFVVVAPFGPYDAVIVVVGAVGDAVAVEDVSPDMAVDGSCSGSLQNTGSVVFAAPRATMGLTRMTRRMAVV